MSELFGPVTPVDQTGRAEARAAIREAAAEAFGGHGALGDVERLGSWLSACLGESALPRPVDRIQLSVIAGDREVPNLASRLPVGASDKAGASFADGSSAVYSAALAQGISVDFLDATPASPSEYEISDLEASFKQGMELADSAADNDVELLLLGDYGRGLTTTAAAVIGAICSIEPVKVIGRGSGVTDDGWKEKVAVIRDDMFSVRDDRADVQRVLEKIGTPSIAVMTGLLAEAATRRTPVIFDGVGATAAALCAQVLVPGAKDWWQAATAGTEPAVTPALRALSLTPLANPGLGLGQGAGTLTVLPLLQLATSFSSVEPTL